MPKLNKKKRKIQLARRQQKNCFVSWRWKIKQSSHHHFFSMNYFWDDHVLDFDPTIFFLSQRFQKEHVVYYARISGAREIINQMAFSLSLKRAESIILKAGYQLEETLSSWFYTIRDGYTFRPVFLSRLDGKTIESIRHEEMERVLADEIFWNRWMCGWHRDFETKWAKRMGLTPMTLIQRKTDTNPATLNHEVEQFYQSGERQHLMWFEPEEDERLKAMSMFKNAVNISKSNYQKRMAQRDLSKDLWI